MALVPCYCGHHMLDPADATYVKDGRPMCHAVTCERSNMRVADLRRRERATRILGSFEEGFSVEDRIGNEVYAAYDFANEV